MFNGQVVVTYFFQLLNLAILVGVFVFVFRSKIFGVLKEMIAEKFSFMRGLEQQKYDLEIKQHALQEQEKEIEVLFQDLSKKIEQWRIARMGEQSIREQHEQDIRARIIKRTAQKNEQVAFERLERAAVPRVAQRLHERMVREFASDKAGHDYLKRVITSLEERA